MTWLNTIRGLVKSMPQASRIDLPLNEALSWFEAELRRAWRA